ncbi:hypothetical protein GUJ93_ZPchr0005g15092 [Zizania palustris]|uniref:Uncharacterized protein n=1 Tax=Zizania palustris TaxID=103762 RepID=A0A8J5W0Z5_ZIZPA|nr:hypothetical protein GUJ93_ZPchr0005g15092 [Zizania palustris]
MLRWERENCKLYVQRVHEAAGYKEKIEFATYFANEISQGLLFEMADQIPSLAELIKVGSLLDFQDAAIEFLLMSKNLQLFPEDEAFLNAALGDHTPLLVAVVIGHLLNRLMASKIIGLAYGGSGI